MAAEDDDELHTHTERGRESERAGERKKSAVEAVAAASVAATILTRDQ